MIKRAQNVELKTHYRKKSFEPNRLKIIISLSSTMQSGCKQTVMATGNKREALNPAEVMILNNGLLLL